MSAIDTTSTSVSKKNENQNKKHGRPLNPDRIKKLPVIVHPGVRLNRPLQELVKPFLYFVSRKSVLRPYGQSMDPISKIVSLLHNVQRNNNVVRIVGVVTGIENSRNRQVHRQDQFARPRRYDPQSAGRSCRPPGRKTRPAR